MTIVAGTPAPDFTLPTDGGGTVTLSSLRGKSLILYFYPKDDTSGCTKEALAFRDLYADFADANAVVVGVSKDGVASHNKFKSKHELNFILASDEDTSVAQSYGVWVEKSMYGRAYMGMDRATFLIGPDGVVREVWRKVKVPGHADNVLKALKALSA